MRIIIFLMIFSALKTSTGLAKLEYQVIKKINNICIQSLPIESAYKDVLENLVCGSPLKDQEMKAVLIHSSLIHLFVVSGTHLVLINQFLKILRAPNLARWILTLIYAMATGWQAPVVRSWFGLLIHRRSDHHVLYAGLLCLALEPQWITSLSLQLSWLAALGVSLKWGKSHISVFYKIILVWILTSPIIISFGSLSFTSLLYQIFIAPIFAFLSLPLALITVAFPDLTPLFDFVMSAFLNGMQNLTSAQTVRSVSQPHLIFYWCWIIFIHVVLHALLTKQIKRDLRCKSL